MKSLAIHAAIGVYHAIVLWKMKHHFHDNKERTEALSQIGRLTNTYLTMWNFITLVMVFYGYLIYDIIRLSGLMNNIKNKYKQILDFYFYSITAPLSIFITLLFWNMWFYDRTLLFRFPENMTEKIFPLWLNQILHTMIVVLVFIQTVHNKVSYQKITKLLLALAAFKTAYAVWINIVFLTKGVWPYPFLENIDEPFRTGLLLFFLLCSISISIVFNHINCWYCSREEAIDSSPEETKKKERMKSCCRLN